MASTSVVGLGGQAAHEVELHLPPAVGVGGGDRPDQVVLGDHLVDHLADPVRAALGREGQPGPPAVPAQLVGERDVERVDPGGRQRQAGLGALVAVGQPGGDLVDLAVVGAGQRQQADLAEAACLPGPRSTMSPIVVTMRSRTGRVIIPAWQNRQPRVQPRKISTLNRSCTDSATGTSGLRGYGQESRSITVCLATARGTPGAVRRDPADPRRPAGSPRRRSAARTRRRPMASRSSRPSRPPGRPARFQSLISSVMASTACSPSPSTAPSMNSAIGSGLNAACPPASTSGWPSPRSAARERDARPGRARSAGSCSRARWRSSRRARRRRDRAVRVDGELRHPVLAHQASPGPARRCRYARRARRRARSGPRTGSGCPGWAAPTS